MIEVIHGHSRAQAEGGQKVPSWSCQRSTEMVPEGTGAGPEALQPPGPAPARPLLGCSLV